MAKKTDEQFPKGAKVKLISGGPTMSVKGYHHSIMGSRNDEDSIVCQWFSGKKLEQGHFAPETLVLVKDDEKEPS